MSYENQTPQGTPPGGYQPQDDPGKSLGIAGMVCGIASLVIPYGGIAVAIVGLILSVIAKKKSEEVGLKNGMAQAGMVCSIIALAWSIVLVVICTSCAAVASVLPY
ncbi:MAG: DUF4190 domain-containing protein [Oscillospiraceae bacterium]|jgi:hypothetical protein|nr:DUF4190 domain-containing protein [Oscillospiraceae bacterium]